MIHAGKQLNPSGVSLVQPTRTFMIFHLVKLRESDNTYIVKCLSSTYDFLCETIILNFSQQSMK